MVKLPDADSLRRVGVNPGTPGVQVGTIDYSPMAAGAKALASGIGGLAAGFKAAGAAQDEVDDYDTKKKLIDFKIQTEMEHEAYKREMPSGGDGFAASWDQTYKKRADTFFGKGGANIAPSQRQKVDFALVQHQATLSERAQRAEMAERDRAEIDGLETTLGVTRSRVEADPNRLEEIRGEGKSLIELSRIPPADRHRLARKYDKELDKTAALTRLSNLKSADDFKAFESDIAPHMAEAQPKFTGLREVDRTTSGLKSHGPIKPEGIVFHYTGGSTVDGAISTLKERGLSYNYLIDKDGTVHTVVPGGTGAQHMRPSEKNNLTAANTIGISYVGQDEDDITPAQRAAGRALAARDGTKFGIPASNVFGHGEVNSHKHSREGATDAAWIREKGFAADPTADIPAQATRGPVPVSQRGLMQYARGETGQPAGAEQPPPVTEASYAGPYKHLSISERRTLWQQAQTQQKKMADGLLQEIKEFSGNAALGKLPPDNVLADLEGRVKAAGDPRVVASYESTLGLADLTRRLQNAPPQAVEGLARDIETRMGDTAMPEEQKRLEHVKKLAESMRKATNDDAMTWAHQRSVMVLAGEPGSEGAAYREPVQLERLDFQAPDIDVTLKRRQLQAQRVAEFYGQPPQFFTKIERDALSDKLRVGGQPMLDVLGKMHKAFGNDMSLAMKEISKNAPEVAILGKLMSEGGDPRLLEDAAKGLKLRTDLGDKFISHVDRKLVEPDVAALTAVLAKTPGLSDPVIRATNAIYEYRHRRDGKDKFDDALYKQTMAEVLGETKDATGTKYGGVGKQGTGWTDGKWSSGVLVPPGVRQDSFDDMIALVQDKDLTGFGRPLHGDGKPLSALEVRRSTWVSVGTGRYVLQTGTESGGTPNYAVDPVNPQQPFVLDVRPLLGEFRKRKPDIFAK